MFRLHNAELQQIWTSHIVSKRYIYSHLGAAGADWKDPPARHFDFSNLDATPFAKLQDWSDSIELFDNWVNLNVIMALASNLETYLASVISLALESDPGTLLGLPRAIDGAFAAKKAGRVTDLGKQQIEACTKGDWSSRLDAFERIFGGCPAKFRASHGDLEELRNIRNRVGHAFGREIDEARKHGTREILAMERVSGKKANKLRRAVWTSAKAIDQFLLNAHIGEYETVRFYQLLHPTLNMSVSGSQRAVYLKKAIGKFGARPRGKVYCVGLVNYWEAL